MSCTIYKEDEAPAPPKVGAGRPRVLSMMCRGLCYAGNISFNDPPPYSPNGHRGRGVGHSRTSESITNENLLR